MPEPPDFDQIAERVALRTGAFQAPLAEVMAELIEQLRQVWNARGAADLEVVDSELRHSKGGPYVVNIARAVRSLDR